MTSVTKPASVTKIGTRVFSYCNELNTIEVESGNLVYHSANNCLIETASKRLIAGCISSIIPLDGSVTSIGAYAFSGCDNISKVYYRGTDTDWNGIELGSNNAYLTSATRYYYSENRPNQVGNYWHYVDGVLTIW